MNAKILINGAAISLTVALGCQASASTAENLTAISVNALVDVRYDDNIGLAPDSSSKREDFSTKLGVQLGWAPIQTAATELAFSVGPYYVGVGDLEDLSHYGVEGAMSLRRQFGGSLRAPFLDFLVNGRSLDFEDSEPRDGYELGGDIALGTALRPGIDLRVGYRYEFRESTDDNPEGLLLNRNSSDVFDLERDGVFASINADIGARTFAFLEYSYMTGEVAATGSASGFNDPGAFDAVRDFAFEEGIRFESWRIDADQNLYTLGMNHRITDQLSVEANVIYLDASAESSNNYENTVGIVGLSWTFF